MKKLLLTIAVLVLAMTAIACKPQEMREETQNPPAGDQEDQANPPVIPDETKAPPADEQASPPEQTSRDQTPPPSQPPQNPPPAQDQKEPVKSSVSEQDLAKLRQGVEGMEAEDVGGLSSS